MWVVSGSFLTGMPLGRKEARAMSLKESNPLKGKAWKRSTSWMSYSPELDGTVENSAMEKGVVCQWFEGRLAWGEGSCVQQGSRAAAVLSRARAPWPGLTQQCLAVPVPWHSPVLSVRLAVSRVPTASGLCCLLGCDWDGLGEVRLSHAKGVPGAVRTAWIVDQAPVLRPRLWRNYSKKQYDTMFLYP